MIRQRTVTWIAALVVIYVFFSTIGCGRAPSNLLRQGQLPVLDFPIYVTERFDGNVWSYDRSKNKTLVASGLNQPMGITSDRFGNLYVVEQGAGQLTRINTVSGEKTVLRSGLDNPSIVAVDSFDQPYVNQEGTTNNIIRVLDGKVIGSYAFAPTAFTFGVNDLLIVGFLDDDRVNWGPVSDGAAGVVDQVVNLSIDGTGRVYAAEGVATNAEIYRFQQTEPGDSVNGTRVAAGIDGAGGIAVDPVGNIYFTVILAGEIRIAGADGLLRPFVDGLVDPRYLTFTKY